MPSTYNDQGVGVNTRKVSPSSMFGTRKLQFLKIDFDYNLLADPEGPNPGDYKNSGSLYHFVVQTIQEVAELYYLGAPSAISENGFVFAIADDTGTWYYSERGNNDDPEQDPGENMGIDMMNTLYDRLYDALGDGWWTLYALEDTGWGLLPGEAI
jgi:hypothetical protein